MITSDTLKFPQIYVNLTGFNTDVTAHLIRVVNIAQHGQNPKKPVLSAICTLFDCIVEYFHNFMILYQGLGIFLVNHLFSATNSLSLNKPKQI